MRHGHFLPPLLPLPWSQGRHLRLLCPHLCRAFVFLQLFLMPWESLSPLCFQFLSFVSLICLPCLLILMKLSRIISKEANAHLNQIKRKPCILKLNLATTETIIIDSKTFESTQKCLWENVSILSSCNYAYFSLAPAFAINRKL